MEASPEPTRGGGGGVPASSSAASGAEKVSQYKWYLLESQNHFTTLRNLPPYGRNHWDRHFHQVRANMPSRTARAF